MTDTILVTGGTGYIGSHTVVALQQAGYRVQILDNLCNSSIKVLDAIAAITDIRPDFMEGDIRDGNLLAKIFDKRKFCAVMHFAGLKAVGESAALPLAYYDNNVNGSVQLLTAMQQAGLRNIIFSSSATVYGEPRELPLTEDHPRSSTNPYGHTKLVVEDILADLQRSDNAWRIARLRYFNPVGAHASGLIGEAPQGTPNNLMPFVAQVATGQRPRLHVYGDDYDTPDGTGVRDYIHVMDLADGHVRALNHCLNASPGLVTVNLGTGKGYSVLEVIAAFERASGKSVPYQVVARRPGDVGACWAATDKAADLLGWRADRNLDQMCQDAWRWESSRQQA